MPKIAFYIIIICLIRCLFSDNGNALNDKNMDINKHLEEKLIKLSKDFPNFGKNILQEFYLDRNYTNVNHGSFGCSPISVMESYQRYQIQIEFNPEKTLRYESFDKINKVLEMISTYIDCNPENLVFIENASDGMNSILKSLFATRQPKVTKKEKVLIFDLAYKNTKSIIEFLQDNYEVDKVEFQITEHILNYNLNNNFKESKGKNKNEDNGANLFNDFLLFNNLTYFENLHLNKSFKDYDIKGYFDTLKNKYNKHQPKNLLFKNTFNKRFFLDKLEEFILQNLPIKAAVIDHISSTPAIVFPVREIVELLNKYNIISIIDGAHTIGHIDLSMKVINADFYISNFYKWFYVPKSTSFLYVNPNMQEFIHPNIITGQYKKGFKLEYLYTGTRDYSIFYSIKDAFQFRIRLGDKAINNYSKNLAYLAGFKILEIWKSELLTYDFELIGNMVNVMIPCRGVNFECKSVDFIAKVVLETLEKYNTFIPTFKFNNNKYYARFSANIYNEISDFIYAAEKFQEILRKNEEEMY